jgi:hypothetical protein
MNGLIAFRRTKTMGSRVRARSVVILLAASAALAACATRGAKLETTEVEGANIAQRSSFAWQPARLVQQGGEATDEQGARLEADVRREVVGALGHKGYSQAAADAADFLVTFQIVVTDRAVATRRDPTPPSVSGSVGPGDPLDIIRDAQMNERTVATTAGSLLIFATDRETGRILWRSVADDTITSTQQALRRIPALVRSMMVKFPEHAP